VAKDKKEEIALVVGGSRGIGRAIALKLARSGFTIWLTYKGNHEAANQAKAEIESAGAACELIPFDVSSFEETEAALGARMENRSPDVLVYNSGISRDNLLMWMTKEEWGSVLSTNLNGFFNVARAAVFSMLKVKRGRIVVISSASGQIGQAGQVNY
jgi:3-oxoacyl-[acyl-carrier protein] reductase